jgi:hypothetical protein
MVKSYLYYTQESKLFSVTLFTCIIQFQLNFKGFQTFRINTTATVEKPSGTYLKNSCHECVKETSDGFY